MEKWRNFLNGWSIEFLDVHISKYPNPCKASRWTGKSSRSKLSKWPLMLNPPLPTETGSAWTNQMEGWNMMEHCLNLLVCQFCNCNIYYQDLLLGDSLYVSSTRGQDNQHNITLHTQNKGIALDCLFLLQEAVLICNQLNVNPHPIKSVVVSWIGPPLEKLSVAVYSSDLQKLC